MGYNDRVPFAALIGKTLTAVTGLEVGSERITFVCADGSEYILVHNSDCCESVQVEDVTGDVANIIGSPITMADESSNSDLATVKGYVDIRWLGESNGYYGETADFEQTVKATTPAPEPTA